MFYFQKNYFLPAVLLFIIEVAIAFFVHDRFVRPYVGDFLVVIFLYCFFKSFLNSSNSKVALGVLLFSYVIEASQYFHLIKRLGLQHAWLARLILGSGFEWLDLIAYTLGILMVLAIEKWRQTMPALARQ